jgi:hypothetical protein
MRFRRAAAVLGAAGAAAGGFAVLAPSADTGPALIRVTGTETRYVQVDIGRKGISPGDTEVITQAIYNLRITRRPIGTAEYVCTFTIARVRSCRGTYVLPRGKLVVGADIRYRQIYELAILGGTGLYANARGTLTATRIDREPKRREYLIFRLAG